MPDMVTRDEAQYQGRKRYFTGVECRRGHIAERFVSNGACVDCVCRKTPKKMKNLPMYFLPERALFFGHVPGPNVTATEAFAAFRAMEVWGWHEAAIDRIRKDPELLSDMSDNDRFTECLRLAVLGRLKAFRESEQEA